MRRCVSLNNTDRRDGHARRRPENISRSTTGNARTADSSQNRGSRTQNPQNGSVGSKNRNVRVYSSGVRGTSAARRTSSGSNSGGTAGGRQMRPVKSVSALTPTEAKKQNKLEKQRKSYLKRQEHEREWQSDIVRVRGGIDGIMLGIILLLVALGSITVFSASYPIAITKTGDSMTYIRKQIMYVILGLIVMTGTIFIPIKFYRTWAPVVAYGVACVLLVAVLFIGTEEGVTQRWIAILPGVNIQPSEIMKLAITLILAWYFAKYENKMKEPGIKVGKLYLLNTAIPVGILGLAVILVLVGKHLSGMIIVGLIGFLILIVAGCNFKWLMFTAVPLGTVAVSAYLVLNPYAMKRILTFTDENADKLDELYQTTQSLYAIGSGGLFGVGPGESRLKFSYLTASHTDFIFSIWCEELGFAGAVALIGIFLIFMWRGYLIALRAPDKFTMLTAFGITTHVGIQALFNMCVAADIFPNTGISLPFFSYGGSSLIVLLFEMGILLSISRQYYKHGSEIRAENAE